MSADSPEETTPADAESPALPRKQEPKKEVARELWERLGKSRPGPDNADLIYLARFVPLLSTAAIKTLLVRRLNIAELRELIQYAPKARDLATKKVLELPAEDVSEDDLRFVLTQTKLADVARVLLKRFPTDSNVALVERSTSELKEQVEKMKLQEPTRSIMREIDRRL